MCEDPLPWRLPYEWSFPYSPGVKRSLMVKSKDQALLD
jgi:hypothetical protein